MKRTIAVGTGLILLAALAFQLGFRGGPLTAPPPWSGPAPDRSAVPQALSLHVLPAGRMLTRAGLSFRGGSFAEERVFGMDVLLIRHPRGDLLIDAGFGRDIDAHFLTTPLSMQLSARYESERPVADQLQAAGLDPASLSGVLLTHAHWDHVSGLADLSGVPVWVSEAELAFARSDDEATRLARQIGLEHWRGFDFPDGPHLGFERSRDWFGDGSEFGVRMVYATEETPLGTAGSVRNAMEELTEPFLVISGDVLTDVDLTKIVAAHEEKDAMVTIGLIRVDNPLEFGIVITREDGSID